MLKVDLILPTMNQTDHCLKEKIKKVIGLMKDEFAGKMMTKFVGLRAKTYNYLIDDGSEDKKTKGTKTVSSKENLNLKIMKTVQKQLKLRIKQIIKRTNKINIDNLKRIINHRNNKSMLKTQKSKSKKQRFKYEKHMFLLKKLTRLLQVQMMIKECNQLIPQKHMLMEGAKIQ